MSRAILLLAALAAAACATSDTRRSPHAGTTSLWREFEQLPEMRAAALAGDPERVWVGAAVGNAASQAKADAGAIAECRRRRIASRIQAQCRLYARGREVVWQSPGARRTGEPNRAH